MPKKRVRYQLFTDVLPWPIGMDLSSLVGKYLIWSYRC